MGTPRENLRRFRALSRRRLRGRVSAPKDGSPLKSARAVTKSKSSPTRDDVKQVLDAIRRIVRVLRLASREAEKRVGLSGAQLFVLQKLAEEPVLSVNEVAARTHTHQSSVSMVVQRLTRRGLVSRRRSSHDARQIDLSVTAAGRAVLRSAPAAAQDQLLETLNTLPSDKLKQIARSLSQLLEAMGIDGNEPPSMLFEEDGVPGGSKIARGERLAKAAPKKPMRKR